MTFPWGRRYRTWDAWRPRWSTTPKESEAIPIDVLVYGCHWNAFQPSDAYQREQSLTEQGPQGSCADIEFARYLAPGKQDRLRFDDVVVNPLARDADGAAQPFGWDDASSN
jgi:hypothetical protein